MHTLKTPHATVFHHSDFSEIQITVTDPEKEPLDISDIEEIYAAFSRQWLESRIENMSPNDLIQLGQRVRTHMALDEKLLTAKEVARWLRVDQWTVSEWVKTGRLRCVRLSAKTLRFKAEDIQKMQAVTQ